MYHKQHLTWRMTDEYMGRTRASNHFNRKYYPFVSSNELTYDPMQNWTLFFPMPTGNRLE